jgi:hypothetical protein
LTEGLGRSPEGVHEFCVDYIEPLASGFRRCVNPWGGGARHRVGPGQWILVYDRLGAKDAGSSTQIVREDRDGS